MTDPKRFLLFCDDIRTFVIFEGDNQEREALLADWMESTGLTAKKASGFAVLPGATPEYLDELRRAMTVAAGTVTVEEPRQTMFVAFYRNAGYFFPEDLKGL